MLQKFYAPVSDSNRYLPRLAITFVGVLASTFLYSKESVGNLVFGDLFSHGFRTTAVIAFIMAVYTFIAVKWIYAGPTAAEIEEYTNALVKQGNVLYEEAKQQTIQSAKNRWIVYVSVAIFFSLIPGVLGALAGAAITKKNR